MPKTKSVKKGRKITKQFYKMKGCSKNKTQKHLGGAILAYPSNNIHRVSNLAYTGSLKNAYPSPGISNQGYKGWLNPQYQHGGDCGCNSNVQLQSGGNNGLPFGQNLPNIFSIGPLKCHLKWPNFASSTFQRL